MLTGARCEKCNHALPLKGELGDFRLPPDSIECPGCGHDCATILPYRVGWMEALLWKVYAIVSVPLSVWIGLTTDAGLAWKVAILVGGPLVGGGLGGYLLGKLTAFPITVVRDAARKSRA